MPRKKTNKAPRDLPSQSLDYSIEELSISDVDELALNFPAIPKDFPLFSNLEEIHENYQMMDLFRANRPIQHEIQESLQNLETYSNWLAEALANLSTLGNPTVRNLLFNNGFLVKQTSLGRYPDKDQLPELILQLKGLASASKKAHKNNYNAKNTKNHARDFALIELGKLWTLATNEEAVLSITPEERTGNVPQGIFNSQFGIFLKQAMLLIGERIQSDNSLMEAYRVASKSIQN